MQLSLSLLLIRLPPAVPIGDESQIKHIFEETLAFLPHRRETQKFEDSGRKWRRKTR